MIVKKGTPEWWVIIALTACNPKRKAKTFTPDGLLKEVNEQLDSINKNPFKRFWILLTNGDIEQRDITEAERRQIYGMDKMQEEKQ